MYLVQKTFFPPPGFPADLYLRQTNPKNSWQASPTDDGRGTFIPLEQHDTLSTNTFFGSFYTAYLQRFTTLGDQDPVLSLSLDLIGRGRVRVFEESGGNVRLLTRKKVASDGSEPVVVPVSVTGLTSSPFEHGSPSSRIFVEFEARVDTRIYALDFLTPTPPTREITLSIGLCTFNQETFFARTLEKITKLMERSDAVRNVYVVNQGAPFESERIHALLKTPGIQLIEQRNLGGCGGFTRTILEAQAAGSASHHLLMDDDIVLDERMIERSLIFLSYTDKDIVVGGAMLDNLRPTVMYEAGAFLRPDNTVIPYCHNVDLTDPNQPSFFNSVAETDYNAWWFCILPLEPTRRVGLPPPIFIRGDDFEYGQRLAREGIPTVTLPGIGVWHEPFYAKPMGWQAYYDLRNRLIFGATYPEKVRSLSLLRMINMLVTPILSHQYMIAELRLHALRDFLSGPDALFARDIEEVHAGVSAVVRRNAPEKLDNAEWKFRPIISALDAPTDRRVIKREYLKGVLSLFLLPFQNLDKIYLETAAHPGNTRNQAYILTNGPRSFHIRLVPQRLYAISRLFSSASLLWRYRRRNAKVSEDWLRRIATFQRTEYWNDVFAEVPKKQD